MVLTRTEPAVEHAAALCFHCGDTVGVAPRFFVRRNGVDLPVCCAGCRAVAELIEASGFGNYYRFRETPALTPSPDKQRLLEAWQRCDQRESLWGEVLADGTRELLLQVEGIRCAACAWLIRSHLEARIGIRSVQVDTATGYARIIWDPRLTVLSQLAEAFLQIGYTPHLPLAEAEERGRQAERRASLQRVGVAGLGMMQVMMYAIALYAGEAAGMSGANKGFLEWVSLIVTLPVVLYSGRVFFSSAWASLRRGRPGMDVPVSLAITLAFVSSCINFFRGEGQVWFDSVVMFIFFLSLGRHIELTLRHRNLKSGAALARMLPEWSERVRGDGTETVPAMDLVEGDRVRVRAGEAFPADGEIISGSSEVNESLLTGESRPLAVRPGSRVIAGSINLSAPLEFRVSAAGSGTVISTLGRMLVRAQIERPGHAAFPQWMVPTFTITVLTLSGLTGWYWSNVNPDLVFQTMLAVLVASCPCALSLAIPAVHASASLGLLQKGIFLTRPEALVALNRVDTVVFDKTGTLTRGEPVIAGTSLNPDRPEFSRDRVLQIAATLEQESAHPLARAFKSHTPAGKARNVGIFSGFGLAGEIDGKVWRIGSSLFIGGEDHQMIESELASLGESHGENRGENRGTHILLADEQGWVAEFLLQDGLREGAEQAVQGLSAGDIQLEILSGDNAAAVQPVAGVLGIRDWRAGQSAANKLERIRRLREQGRRILMVGDGVNDAPVLAAADVSMTVKGGADLAHSAADLILSSGSLEQILQARGMASAAVRLIRQNLLWALFYNISIIPLAMSGHLQPWMAALGMSASSLLVVGNATRLAQIKQTRGRHAR